MSKTSLPVAVVISHPPACFTASAGTIGDKN